MAISGTHILHISPLLSTLFSQSPKNFTMWQSLLAAAVAGSIALVANHFFKRSAIGASQQPQQNGVSETHLGSQPPHKEDQKDDVFKPSTLGKRPASVQLTWRVGLSFKRRKTGNNFGAGNQKSTPSTTGKIFLYFSLLYVCLLEK